MKRLAMMVGMAALVGVSMLWLAYVGRSAGWTSADFSAALQAVGATVAILAVTVPVLLEQRVKSAHARAMTLAACDGAFSMMNDVADFIVNPDSPRSDWWAPQWGPVLNLLSSAPIYETGSAPAVAAFLEFHELAVRASTWLETSERGDPAGSSMVVTLMLNASRVRDQLRTTLGRPIGSTETSQR